MTSRDGLAAWAEADCCGEAIDPCEIVPDTAVPLWAGRVACLPAIRVNGAAHGSPAAGRGFCGRPVRQILVPFADSTAAFIADAETGLVTIVSPVRPDNLPAAAR